MLRFFFLLIALLLPLRPAVSDGNAVRINEILTSNTCTNLEPKSNNFVEWIELYNAGEQPADLTGLYLTDDLAQPARWRITSDTPSGNVIAPKGYRVIWTDGLNQNGHANFKLDRDGEAVGLFDSNRNRIDSIQFPAQRADVSYGRQPDAGGDWIFFAEPTPGKANLTEGIPLARTAQPPEFSLAGGFHDREIRVSLSSPAPAAVIRFTTDGSIPSRASSRHESPVAISRTMVLRARAFEAGRLPSAVVTQTYFIGETFTLPTVSLSMNPEYLWDDRTGIYVTGTNGIPGNCDGTRRNFNQDWERPLHIEFYEPDGQSGFQAEAGVKIFGGCSRDYPQKSLAFYTRKKYGTEIIEYPLFPDKPIRSYNNFLLRNGGNDWIRTLFSDAMMQYLLKDRMDIDYQAYRPAILFLNGEYRGIMNLREKLNEHYAAQNYGIDPEQVDLIENGSHVMNGDARHYNALLDTIYTQDVKKQDVYAYIQTQMDADEYMNYVISKIYYSSMDWPHNNIKYWRPRTPDGRWRWMTYDNDSGFGIWWPVTDNTLNNVSPVKNGNPFFLGRLLLNPSFRDTFIQRFAAHINTTFAPTRVKELIGRMQAVLEPEMPRQIERWGRSGASGWGYSIYTTMSEWRAQIDLMRRFAERRPSIQRQHLQARFGLKGTANFTLRSQPAGAGHLWINNVSIESENTTGIYFLDVPLRARAEPKPGYRFMGWLELPEESQPVVSLSLTGDAALTAVFEENTGVEDWRVQE